MEIRKKKISLAGLFGRYIFMFVTGTFFAALISGAVMFFLILIPSGPFLPANYAEQQLINTKETLQEADITEEEMIPSGSLYGVFDREGRFLYGTFDEEVQKDAWKKYKTDNIYPQGKGYYFFVEKNNGEICIIKYFVAMRYAKEKLNEILPSPEAFNMILTLGTFITLTVLNGCYLSGKFGRKLKKQLACLTEATARISENDLEFTAETSEIREVDEVMASLEKMKEALKVSLKTQWDTEQLKNQQLSALTHDIKTPLTVVRGNAELLVESELQEDDRECAEEILKNAGFIADYLDSMRQVLKGQKEQKSWQEVSVEELSGEICDFVRQLAAVRKIPLSFEVRTEKQIRKKEAKKDFGKNVNRDIFPLEGSPEEAKSILCCKEEILRAWGNLVDNAIEHTDPEKGICVIIEKHMGREASQEEFVGEHDSLVRQDFMGKYGFVENQNWEKKFVGNQELAGKSEFMESCDSVRDQDFAEKKDSTGNQNPAGKSDSGQWQDHREYLKVSVRDYGPGFSQKALLHGKEAFFSGDESRHDRTHQGLGLSIAAYFMKRQGGFVEYHNVDKSQGAEASLWICMKR